jgi:two-component system, chemotaxis family, chemotaxis protein CheY
MSTAIGINTISGANYNVLIADDSYTDRVLLKRFLQIVHFNVVAEVPSGEGVIDYLRFSKPIPDIIFLDFQMEPKNAIDVIKEIKPQYPNIKIVVVTGNTDKEVISELIKMKINSYILKPINKSTLDEKLIQLLGRTDLVLQSKIAPKKNPISVEALSIPPLPSVAQKILLFEGDASGGSHELEQIILPDKSIAADLLRMSNSAFYGRSKKVQTIKEAITLLGLKTIKNIVMLQTKKHISRNLTYSTLFKKHLLESPILTALIALDLTAPFNLKSLREELFLSGMMRKIGMTVLALNSPESYTEILTLSESKAVDLAFLEKEEYNLNHLEVGLFIFQKWDMPEVFRSVMRNQNFKLEEFSNVSDLDRILRCADILSRSILKVPILESELTILHEIAKHYKSKGDLLELFSEDYYEGIKSHPFFETS